MSLTPDQQRLVRATLPVLQKEGEHITSVFYSSLLGAHPELRNAFNQANQANGRQPRALTSLIIQYAAHVADTSALVDQLERVCQKHCSLGIEPAQYAVVGEYLLLAFRQVLGAAMTADVEAAWAAAYGLLARMMIGREAQLYRSFGAAWQRWRRLRVVRKVCEAGGPADEVCSFYLAPEAPGEALPHYQPGQYVSVRLRLPDPSAVAAGAVPPPLYYQARQYSLSDRWRPDAYRISVRRDRGTRFANAVAEAHFFPGLVSNALLDGVREGDVVEVSHPAGDFFCPGLAGGASSSSSCSSAPLVLLSAGVGATPMLAILSSAAAAQPQRPVAYVHGTRAAPPLFDAELRALQRSVPRLQTVYFVSGETKAGAAAAAAAGQDRPERHLTFAGRIDLDKLTAAADDDLLFLRNSSTEYYVCGPEPFMLAMAKRLQDLGIAEKRVRFELFSTGELEKQLEE